MLWAEYSLKGSKMMGECGREPEFPEGSYGCWEVGGSRLISVCILEGLKRAETETSVYFFLIVEITIGPSVHPGH